ncbi:MAG: HYR domain-containing protein, partial [Bacteroidales bacterium]
TAFITLADPIYSDNCSIEVLKWEMTGVTNVTSPDNGINLIGTYEFSVGVTNIEYTVIDAAGNSASCSFIVTVSDNVLPVAICKDTIIDLDALGNGSILAGSIDGGSYDNCGMASITASKTNFNLTDIGDNTVTLTATDIYGNVSTCDATVTVNAALNIPPASANVDRNDLCSGDGSIVLSYSGGLLTTGSSAEWYSDASFTNNVGSGNNLNLPAPAVTTTYYVRFEGIIDTTSAVSITVNVFSLPIVGFSAITEVCEDALPFDLTQGTPVGGTYSGPGITSTPEFDPVVAGSGTHTLTYSYTDVNGCTDSTIQTITVNPVPAPSVSGITE